MISQPENIGSFADAFTSKHMQEFGFSMFKLSSMSHRKLFSNSCLAMFRFRKKIILIGGL
jgi:hypothetical protein